MQSSGHWPNPSHITLGERRGKSDLARFSLDPSWPRGVSETGRSWAYPSPPMSTSPPPPLRRNPETDNRGRTSFNISAQDGGRGTQPPQGEQRDNVRMTQPSIYQNEAYGPGQYQTFQQMGQAPMEHSQFQYAQHRPQPQQQQIGAASIYPSVHSHQHPPMPSQDTEGRPVSENSDHASPKSQRKTKGHVASACVPCKKAHLRCDAQRPCSRCISNGKEDNCVDVRHKKRGRPRLRDEREPPFEGLGATFAPQQDQMMRRPMSAYASSEASIGTLDSLHRSPSYRVLKSQSGPSSVPRYQEIVIPHEANMYAGQGPPVQHLATMQEPPCAYLTMDMQIAKASRTFCEAIDNPSINTRMLLDIVTLNDRDKVYRLQRMLEEERREREPNYLPPIYPKAEGDRVIKSIGLSAEEISSYMRTELQEVLTFRAPDGQQRTFQVRIGIAKKDSTYFVFLILVTASKGGVQSLPSTPYSRDTQQSFQAPQQGYSQPPPAMAPYGQYAPQYNEPRGREQPMSYHQPPPLASSSGSMVAPTPSGPAYGHDRVRSEYAQSQYGREMPRGEQPPLSVSASGSMVAPAPGAASYGQNFGRSDYNQSQYGRQMPLSEPQQPAQSSRQNELQLPPILSQTRPSQPSGRRNDDRSGRLDIGGLLENPEAQRR